MGRGVVVCDWTKKVIEEESDGVDVVMNTPDGSKEFVFSQDGYDALISHLEGNEPLVVSEPLPADTSRILTKADAKPPTRTRQEGNQIVSESTVADPGYLDNLGSGRSAAQKRLDAMNRKIELDLDHDKEKVGD